MFDSQPQSSLNLLILAFPEKPLNTASLESAAQCRGSRSTNGADFLIKFAAAAS